MKLKFFGCSFTEGGGLDNIDYYNFLNENKLEYFPEKFETNEKFDVIILNEVIYYLDDYIDTLSKLSKFFKNVKHINLCTK